VKTERRASSGVSGKIAYQNIAVISIINVSIVIRAAAQQRKKQSQTRMALRRWRRRAKDEKT